MPNTTPDNLRYPNGTTKVGRLWQHFKNLADDTQLALNSLTNQHSEFKASRANMPESSFQDVGDLVLNAAVSTSSTIAVTTTDRGSLAVQSPGLYAVSTFTRMGDGTTVINADGLTFLEMTLDGAVAQRVSMQVGFDSASLSYPNLRITTPGQRLKFSVYRNVANTGPAVETWVRITKIGRL